MKKDIEELKEKIIGNAEKEAETNLSRARKAKKRILQKAEDEVKKIKEEADEKGRSLFEKEKSRIRSKKKMDKQKEKLVLRKQLVDFLIADKEYIDYLREICKGLNGISISEEKIKPGFLIRGKNNEYDFRFSVLAENIIKQKMGMIIDKIGVDHG
ncbi:MAG: hypothetical protein P8Y62_09700 [candidate division WOR-3 bacterium]